MALHRQKSDGLVRLLAVALAVGMLATVGLFAMPSAHAAFGVPGLSVAASRYWGGTRFVPGETMSITLRATSGDSIDLLIQNASGNPSYSRTGIVMPTTAITTIAFVIPTAWPDADTYSVQATDTTSGQTRTVLFTIETYRLTVWPDRQAFLPGDSVQITWSAVYAQNGTPAPAGIGAIQVQDGGGANLLSPRQYNLTASQGSFSFNLDPGIATGQFAAIFAWFNDTAGNRESAAGNDFGIGNLGVTVTVALPTRGYFEPGEYVPVTVQSTITGVGGGLREPDVAVSVNVTDQSTGLIVPAYSNTAMTTDKTGTLNYVFQLGMTPTSGSYQVTATDTAHGTLSATASAAPFNVRAPPSFTASVTLDKTQYISGDPVEATAHVVSQTSQTFYYTWWVLDNLGNILAYQAGGQDTYTYTTSSSFQGTITVQLRVENGTGGVINTNVAAPVAFGYLSVTLDRSQFNPGDTITATATLSSSLMTNPTYFWTIQDSAGSVVASVNGTSTARYTTPSPSASTRYTFFATATQSGRSVSANQVSTRNDGYYLSVTLDKSNYNPGDTMVMTYRVTALGVSALPSSFRFDVELLGVISRTISAPGVTGTLSLAVPGNSPTGNLLLLVVELNTGAAVYNVVHVGAINPLVSDVGGVPLFDILITLLFVVLLLAVILLWRRTGMGTGPSAVAAGKPSTPPPPPPSGPSQQTAGPMSVACKHCGASIEITTSKRPIEVMCPSCGETQVVQ